MKRARQFGRRCVANEQGAAAIEFGFLAAILVALLGGAVDLFDEQTRRREVDRITVEVAEALANCPDTDCVRKGVQALIDSDDVVLGSTPGGALGTAEITRVDNVLIVLQGSMTFLPDDLKNEALAVLDEQDVGIAVLVSYTYEPLVGLISSDTKVIRRYAVALRAKDIKLI